MMLMALHLYKWLLLWAGMLSAPLQPALTPEERHPLYVSVSEVNHNANDKNLEISCKIFTDDLEKTLSTIYKEKVDLFTPKDRPHTEKQIAEYLQKRFVVQVDGKPVTLEFVGFERDNDAIWSYFQVAMNTAPKKIDIHNTILHELYEKQLNLMHVTVGGKRKSTRLNYPDADAKFEY